MVSFYYIINITLLVADLVTDIAFSPFSDWLLATASHDGSVSLNVTY